MRLDELLEVALQHCHLTRTEPLLIGVSGGPDSLCLLDGLARLEFNLVVVHFDHRLRPDSGLDAAKVRAAAEARGARFFLGSADVSGYARAERLSLEEAARILRYRFLFEQARCHSAQAVAVGHTAGDQVETVLMHLLRGAGLGGLKGMSYRALLPDWDDAIPLVRPLLPFWRAEILDYCQAQGLQPVIDHTNQDITFARNRLRHELIPFLETYNPQIQKNVWNMAQALAGDDAVVQSAVEAAWAVCAAGQGDGWVALRRVDFLALSPGLQRGVLRRAIAFQQQHAAKQPDTAKQPHAAKQREAAPVRDVDFETIERAIRYAHTARAGQVDLVHGLCLAVEGDRLLVRQAKSPPDPAWPQMGLEEVRLAIPGEAVLDQGWRLESAWMRPADIPDFPLRQTTAWEAWLDADALPSDLSLRRARPGDRFAPLGMDGHSLKLSDFWINQKLPRRARANWPLVAAGENIVWVPGCRLAHPYRIQSSTRRVLHLLLKRDR